MGIKNKRTFFDTIKRSYKKNVDYLILKFKESKGSGGQNNEVIKLTPVAAKKLCLASNSINGSKVREYFIEVERVLYNYKNYIIKGLEDKIKQLENNQKPIINKEKKIIYVFKALNTDLTLYKLGKAINSKTRFNSFNSHNSPLANDIVIIFQYETENIDQVGSCVKSLMKGAQYRKYKEIYKIDLNILKKMIKRCDLSINEVNN